MSVTESFFVCVSPFSVGVEGRGRRIGLEMWVTQPFCNLYHPRKGVKGLKIWVNKAFSMHFSPSAWGEWVGL